MKENSMYTKSVPSQSLALLGFPNQLVLGGGQKDGAPLRMWSQEAQGGPMALGCSQ